MRYRTVEAAITRKAPKVSLNKLAAPAPTPLQISRHIGYLTQGAVLGVA